MHYLWKINLLIMILIAPVLAQWEVSPTINYKSEIPSKGFGIQLSRNLPVQFSDIGVKARFGIDLFRETRKEEISGIVNERKFLSEDYQLGIIGTLFFRYISPYFGINTGLSHYSIREFDNYIFVLGVITGIKIPVTSWLHPALEISSSNYFSSFNVESTGEEISSLQFTGRVVVIIKL